MKKVLFSILTLAVLVSCNNKDDSTPINISKEQQNYLPTKKVKRVVCTYIDEDTQNTHPSITTSTILNAELYDQEFTQKTKEYLYEYDSAGRINKITIKNEGEADIQSTLVYTDNSVLITSPNRYRSGKTELVTIEHGLNAAGNMLGIGMYNQKQQLMNSIDAGIFTWENDNLTKITSKYKRNNKIEEENVLYTYNQKENKNKLYLLDEETSDTNTLENYFDISIALIRGTAPKNLPIKISSNEVYRDKYSVEFSYTFDSDDFIKTISEKKETGINGWIVTSIYDQAEVTAYFAQLQTLITNIQNGIVTDKRYKLISDKEDDYRFEITIPIKVEKDKNGKTINLNVFKICEFHLVYDTENNTKKLHHINVTIRYKADMLKHYELNY